MAKALSLTSRGEIVISGADFTVTLQLTPDELRDFGAMCEDVADTLEDDAAALAADAIERAKRGPLQ